MSSLEQVRTALIAKLGDESKLVLVNARLILRTGVNLSVIDPRRAKDHHSINRVLAALRDMGFDLKS